MKLSMSLIKRKRDREEGNIGNYIADERPVAAGLANITGSYLLVAQLSSRYALGEPLAVPGSAKARL